MKFLVTMSVEIEADNAEQAEHLLSDVLQGNDDICDVEAAMDALDFTSIQMTSKPI